MTVRFRSAIFEDKYLCINHQYISCSLFSGPIGRAKSTGEWILSGIWLKGNFRIRLSIQNQQPGDYLCCSQYSTSLSDSMDGSGDWQLDTVVPPNVLDDRQHRNRYRLYNTFSKTYMWIDFEVGSSEPKIYVNCKEMNNKKAEWDVEIVKEHD